MFLFLPFLAVNLYWIIWLEKLTGSNSIYFITGLITILNINMIVIFLYFKPRPVYIIYFIYHIIAFPMPYFTILRKSPSMAVVQDYFMDFSALTPSSLFYGTLLIFAFDFMIILFLLVMPKSEPSPIFKWRIGDMKNPDVFAIVIIMISVGAKLFLISKGQWSIVASEDTQEVGPLTDTMKNVARNDLFMMLILGYIINNADKVRYSTRLIYYAGMTQGLIFGLMSGSKQKILEYAIVMLFNMIYNGNKKSIVIFLIVGGMMSGIFFPLISQYRKDTKAGYMVALQKTLDDEEGHEKEAYDPREDHTMNRLNYHRIICMLVRTYPPYRDEYDILYTNNIVALVPRFMWPAKPVIKTNANQRGRDIGLLGLQDFKTSIGTGTIGDAYCQLGIYGLFVGPFLVALIIFIYDRKIDMRYPMGYAYAFLLPLDLTYQGSINTIVPTVVKQILISAPLFLYFNKPLIKIK